MGILWKMMFSVTTIFLATGSSALALTASPTRLELEGDKGESVSAVVEFYNESRQVKTYELSTANFESRDESGQPQFVVDQRDLAVWVELAETRIELKPLERRKINFLINIPQTAEPGGYFAGILGTNVAGESDSEVENEVEVESTTGTLLLLRVKGELQEGADILDFQTKDKQRVFKSLPVDFSYRFQNTGNSWVKPLGDVVIENIVGGTTKIVPANPDGGNVLTKSIRKFQTSWLTRAGQTQDMKAPRPPELPSGFWNRVKHEVKYFALGRYTANLTLNYGDNEPKQAQASTVFWVLPWELLFVVVASLVLILGTLTAIATFVILKILKRRNKN